MSLKNPNIGVQDCYDTILEYFKTNTDSPSKREMWKNKAYVKLIELWKHGKITIYNARNALILLLNLFEDIPPDIFNSRGKSLKEERESEHKHKLKNILKQEISM